MKYQSRALRRRDFIKLTGIGLIGAYVAGISKPVYACVEEPLYASGSSGDDVFKNPELLKVMTKVVKKYRPLMGKEEEYKFSYDVNGDGKNDNVVMSILKDKSILDGNNPVYGDMFVAELVLSGQSGSTKISCIVGRDGNVSILKTFWSIDTKVPEFLETLLKYDAK